MRILVATDGSEGAQAATEWLTTFPLPEQSEVLVLVAAEIPWAALAEPTAASMAAYDEAVLGAAQRAGDEARAVLARRWPSTQTRVVHGDARALIPQHAGEWRADLVVVGARGLGAVAGFFLGSVSSAVVHAAPCAVLVVKGQPRRLRRVLIAVDGSEDALAAARFYAALPVDASTVVELVGVVDPPRMPRTAPALVTPALQQAVAAALAERRASIDQGLARAEAEIVRTRPRVERSTPTGSPADEIVSAAKAHGADLVVLGARGLGPIQRLFIGSVSDRVLHHAECPVLVVKRLGAGGEPRSAPSR